jgi:hypothetical protein
MAGSAATNMFIGIADIAATSTRVTMCGGELAGFRLTDATGMNVTWVGSAAEIAQAALLTWLSILAQCAA